MNCPIPLREYPRVVLPHGGGGRLMHQLVDRMFGSVFTHPALESRHDGAVLPNPGQRLAFTTDSYVIQPRFFPGGDIGSLAVCGTVNDLAMCGARPRYLSLGLILEEGLPMDELWRIVQSIGKTAEEAGVGIVTGDTKVVERGKGDGVFINTSGIGTIDDGVDVSPARMRTGDAVILSGDVGRHGTAVMAARNAITLTEPLASDCASLDPPVRALIQAGCIPHCMRDLTRGGLATALVELATTSGTSIRIEEATIGIDSRVADICELFGLDPLYVANEGRFVAVLDPGDAEEALAILRRLPETGGATRIGVVDGRGGEAGMVTMRTRFHTSRIIDMLSGEQLPRIC